MRKLFSRRPSAGVVIGFVALCVALGGGAYAATHKKVEYKGLSKDARLKVLPVSSTNANTGTTPCDPTSSTFVNCTQVSVNGSTAFPRRYLIVATGVLNGNGSAASGECRLEVNGTPLNGTTNKIHTEGGDASVSDSIVTTPQGGQHTIQLACNETSGDVKLPSFQLSAIQVR